MSYSHRHRRIHYEYTIRDPEEDEDEDDTDDDNEQVVFGFARKGATQQEYCARCNERVPNLQVHIEYSDKHHVCKTCFIDFDSNWARIQHFVQSPAHHYCQQCDIEFEIDDELQFHFEVHHFYCAECNKFFKNKFGLYQHDRQTHLVLLWDCPKCDLSFHSESNLNSHLNSSAHKPRTFPCLGRFCKQEFLSEAGLIAHWESGHCSSGITRQILDRKASELDQTNILTNPNWLLQSTEVPGSSVPQTILRATERCWNGSGFECILCHRQFRSLGALNSHLQSPAHQEKIYKCPTAWGGCRKQFNTLSGLFQHVESESCGVKRFSKNVRDAIDSLAEGMKRLTV